MILRVSKSSLHCGVACIALFCATGAWAQEKPINIPAEDGGKSIPELARQAGVQIIAPGQALHGVVTPRSRAHMKSASRWPACCRVPICA